MQWYILCCDVVIEWSYSCITQWGGDSLHKKSVLSVQWHSLYHTISSDNNGRKRIQRTRPRWTLIKGSIGSLDCPKGSLVDINHKHLQKYLLGRWRPYNVLQQVGIIMFCLIQRPSFPQWVQASTLIVKLQNLSQLGCPQWAPRK